jgi:hypothetical protein
MLRDPVFELTWDTDAGWAGFTTLPRSTKIRVLHQFLTERYGRSYEIRAVPRRPWRFRPHPKPGAAQ